MITPLHASTEHGGGARSGIGDVLREVAARGGHVAARPDPSRRAQRADHVLATRGALRPGELVTLFAPIAEALAAVHARSWSHGDVSLEAIRIDARGAPVLTGWHEARAHSAVHPGLHRGDDREPAFTTAAAGSRPRGRGRAWPKPRPKPRPKAWPKPRPKARLNSRSARAQRGAGMALDAERLASLIREHLPDTPQNDTLVEALDDLEHMSPDARAQSIAHALFAWATPEAITLADDVDGATAHVKNPDEAIAPIDALHGSGSAEAKGTSGMIGALRRRPLLVGAGLACAVIAAGVLGLELLEHDRNDALASDGAHPVNDEHAAHEGGSMPGDDSLGDDGLDDAGLDGDALDGDALEDDSPEDDSPDGGAAPGQESADDPVAAIGRLLDRRAVCLADEDVECLVGLYTSDAPGVEFDLALLGYGHARGADAGDACSLVDRTGDIALARCGAVGVTAQWTGERWLLREVHVPPTTA